MKRFFALLLALTVLLALPLTASANAAEPPTLTVMVINAPPGLELHLETAEGRTVGGDGMISTRAWETYYRFFRAENATVLTATLKGETARFDIGPFTHDYNNFIRLDWAARSVSGEVPGWRTPLYMALRVVLTFLIEGAVFYSFGFRKKRSWLVFILVNILTQALLNSRILSWNMTSLDNNFFIALFFLLVWEGIITLAEMIAFGLLITEEKHPVICAFIANLLSLILGGLLITLLPL